MQAWVSMYASTAWAFVGIGLDNYLMSVCNRVLPSLKMFNVVGSEGGIDGTEV